MNAPFDVADIALAELEGEPRGRDLDIAERLGFERPRDIRKLIERHRPELETFGVCATVAQTHGAKGGRPGTEFWLNEEQALLVAVLSEAANAPAVRAMLIRVFVAWRRGHLSAEAGLPIELDRDARRAIGGIVKGIVRRELAEIIPALIREELASKSLMIRAGKTAGMLWDAAGLPKLKSAAVWFGNRLAEMGCQIADSGRADIGGKAVRLFDPDKAQMCLRNGLLITAGQYAAERKGQTKLHLAPKKP